MGVGCSQASGVILKVKCALLKLFILTVVIPLMCMILTSFVSPAMLGGRKLDFGVGS